MAKRSAAKKFLLTGLGVIVLLVAGYFILTSSTVQRALCGDSVCEITYETKDFIKDYESSGDYKSLEKFYESQDGAHYTAANLEFINWANANPEKAETLLSDSNRIKELLSSYVEGFHNEEIKFEIP